MLQDLRFGLKLLWKEKAFAITALLTLALCIGANSAIFTVLNAVILEPLHFPEPERLITMYNLYPGVGVSETGSNGIPDYLDRKELRAFDSLSIFGTAGYDVGAQGSPARIDGEFVSPWKSMYARDPDVLGKDLRLSGVPYRIVGVMPEGFESPTSDARLWVPFAFRPEQTKEDQRHSNNWSIIARLKRGATIEQARQQIDALNRHNTEKSPFGKLLINARFYTKVIGLKDALVKDVKSTLYLLEGAVVFVLLIGCVNVANLMVGLAFILLIGAGRSSYTGVP